MKKILMVCEAFGGGVFSYVSQLCNDMADDFDVYLAHIGNKNYIYSKHTYYYQNYYYFTYKSS